jgi:hypothetical protein
VHHLKIKETGKVGEVSTKTVDLTGVDIEDTDRNPARS